MEIINDNILDPFYILLITGLIIIPVRYYFLKNKKFNDIIEKKDKTL